MTSTSRTSRRFIALLVANLAQRLGQLALLALLVVFSTADNVAVFGLFSSFFVVCGPLFTQNVHMAVGRLWFSVSEPETKPLAATLLATGLAMMVVGGGFAIAVLAPLARVVPIFADLEAVRGLLFVGLCLFVVAQFFHALLRATDRVIGFVWLNVGQAVALPIVFLVGAVAFDAARAGAFYAYVAGQAVAAFVGVVAAHDCLAGGRAWLRPRLLRPAFAFGAGGAAYMITQWAVNYAGRWIGAAHLGTEELAGYTLVSQLYSVVGSITLVFFEAYRVPVLRRISEGRVDEGLRLLDRAARLAAIGVIAIHVAVAIAWPFVAPWIEARYRIGPAMLVYCLLISGASVYTGRANWIAIGLYRTQSFAVIGLVCSAVGMSIAASVVAVHGIHGLMLASLFAVLSHGLVATGLYQYARRNGAAVPPPTDGSIQV